MSLCVITYISDDAIWRCVVWRCVVCRYVARIHHALQGHPDKLFLTT